MILSQIADLREFAEAPEQPYPDFGIDAPRLAGTGRRANGIRWYNHNPQMYLECATAGALGGWDAADGRRTEVPGPVVPLYPEPQEVAELPALTWLEFADFLICGQEYE